MTTRITRQLLSGTKIIQTQSEDVADAAVAGTPNVVAIQTAYTIYNKPGVIHAANDIHRV